MKRQTETVMSYGKQALCDQHIGACSFFNTIMAQTNQSEYIFSNGFLQQPWEVRSRYIFDMIRHALAKKVNILQRCIHGFYRGYWWCRALSGYIHGPLGYRRNISVDFAKSKERSLTRNLATLSICQMNNVPAFCLAYNSLCIVGIFSIKWVNWVYIHELHQPLFWD